MNDAEICIDMADRPACPIDEESSVLSALAVERAEYPDNYTTTRHRHHCARLLHAVSGAVAVSTPQGVWIAPPGHGLLIPPGADHDAHMFGNVIVQILDIKRASAVDLGENCFVVDLSPLLRHLIETVATPRTNSPSSGRETAIAGLLLYDLQHSPRRPLFLPLPSDTVLAQRCTDFLKEPRAADSIEQWSVSMGISRRTFTRRFRSETGLSFVAWRQRACLIAAIARMAQGDPIRKVAFWLGYASPVALAAMFKRWLGTTPTAYLQTWR